MKLANELAEKMFGRTQQYAWENNICVRCGQPAYVWGDETSRREYMVSALCPKCFDDFVMKGEV